MKYLLLFAMTSFFFSCKDKTPTNKVVNNVVRSDKQLIVEFTFKTDQEDMFIVVMNNIIVDEFQRKAIQINETVPPSANFERIVAKFDTNNFSNYIGINLGPKNKEIELNKIKFSYDNNIVSIDKTNFIELINLNDFVEFDEEKSVLKTKTVGGKSNPVITMKQTLINRLLKN